MSLTGLACGQIDQLHEEAGDILTALVETFPKRSLAVPVWKPPPPPQAVASAHRLTRPRRGPLYSSGLPGAELDASAGGGCKRKHQVPDEPEERRTPRPRRSALYTAQAAAEQAGMGAQGGGSDREKTILKRPRQDHTPVNGTTCHTMT